MLHLISNLNSFILIESHFKFIFWPCQVAYGILAPNQGLNLSPLCWKHGVFTTGLLGEAHRWTIYGDMWADQGPFSQFTLFLPWGMTFIFRVHGGCESYSHHIKIPSSQMEEVTKKDAAPLCLLIHNFVNLVKYPYLATREAGKYSV